MKPIHNKIKFAIGILVIATIVISCLPKQESMGGAGQTLVKLFPSVYNLLPFDAITTPQTGILFEVRRDIPSNAALNTTTTVVLKYDADTAIMNHYNSVNGTSYEPLPAELGTVTPAITNGIMTINMAAGDFSQSITVNVPSAGNFDFSKHYALAFCVQSVSGTGTLSAGVNDTILCEVLAKNQWDGVYTVTGSFVDYVTTAWIGYYPKTVQLQTSGSQTCNKYDADFGIYGYIFNTDNSGTSQSYFGNWTPAFSFDANNNVNVFNTTVDPLPRQRTAVLYTGDGAASNKYDPATKSMDVSYQMSQLTVSPVLRNLIIEHYAYKGPR
ncbi:MAG: DUF1735 domain-containing protein [Bacteroidales bacterium]